MKIRPPKVLIFRLRFVAMTTSLERLLNECRVYQALHSSTNPKNLVKICDEPVAPTSTTKKIKKKLAKYIAWTKNGLFLRVVDFVTVNERKVCDMSKLSEFCAEKSFKLACQCI